MLTAGRLRVRRLDKTWPTQPQRRRPVGRTMAFSGDARPPSELRVGGISGWELFVRSGQFTPLTNKVISMLWAVRWPAVVNDGLRYCIVIHCSCMADLLVWSFRRIDAIHCSLRRTKCESVCVTEKCLTAHSTYWHNWSFWRRSIGSFQSGVRNEIENN